MECNVIRKVKSAVHLRRIDMVGAQDKCVLQAWVGTLPEGVWYDSIRSSSSSSSLILRINTLLSPMNKYCCCHKCE